MVECDKAYNLQGYHTSCDRELNLSESCSSVDCTDGDGANHECCKCVSSMYAQHYLWKSSNINTTTDSEGVVTDYSFSTHFLNEAEDGSLSTYAFTTHNRPSSDWVGFVPDVELYEYGSQYVHMFYEVQKYYINSSTLNVLSTGQNMTRIHSFSPLQRNSHLFYHTKPTSLVSDNSSMYNLIVTSEGLVSLNTSSSNTIALVVMLMVFRRVPVLVEGTTTVTDETISDRDNSRLLVSLALGPNIELTETDEDEAGLSTADMIALYCIPKYSSDGSIYPEDTSFVIAEENIDFCSSNFFNNPSVQWFDPWSFSNDSTFIQILDSSDSIDSSETRNLFRHGISLKHTVIQDSISKDADNQLVVTLKEGSHEFIIDSLLSAESA
ncbi:hypothetical protein ADUPG1_010045 [Aduncisulcus paluster]|uniref:Uncharacterized protein n=1 Tax=Aduncisulcus paluster TaxID=2918883 RepID=A0ABQ5L1I3_9EUKA|nr:hypothetical protein ADUPG1_010045 [Aduncisulcus paluster]